MKNKSFLKTLSIVVLTMTISLLLIFNSHLLLSSKEIDIHTLLKNASHNEYESEANITILTPGANSYAEYYGYNSVEIIKGSFIDEFQKEGYIFYLLSNLSDINNFVFNQNQKYVIAINNSSVAHLGHNIFQDTNMNDRGSYDMLEKLVEKTIEKYLVSLYGASLENYKIPRINMVGHSRGGINNMLFAINHPLLVNKLFSVGTPYTGSSLYTDVLNQGVDMMKYLGSLAIEQCVDSNIYNNLKAAWNEYKNNDSYYYHAQLHTISGLTSYGNVQETVLNFVSSFDISLFAKFFLRTAVNVFLNTQEEIINEDNTYSVLYKHNFLMKKLTELCDLYETYKGKLMLGSYVASDMLVFVKYILSVLNHLSKTESGIYYTKSDFFVDDDSQSAEGFVIDYNYKKIFTYDNSNFAYHMFDSYPAIVHAQEPLDSDVISYVLNNIQ